MNRRVILTLMLSSVLLSPVAAQNTAEFDRFFTNSSTRKQLDQAREQHTSIGPVTDEDEAPQDTLFPKVEVKGLIVRNNGSSEIWLNGASTIGKGGLSQEIKAVAKRINREQVQVTLPDGRLVTLKPGQIYTPDSQKVLEAYQTVMPVDPESTSIAEEIEKAKEQSAEEKAEAEKGEEFDESVLAETDTKIKLLEERIQKLEGQR